MNEKKSTYLIGQPLRSYIGIVVVAMLMLVTVVLAFLLWLVEVPLANVVRLSGIVTEWGDPNKGDE